MCFNKARTLCQTKEIRVSVPLFPGNPVPVGCFFCKMGRITNSLPWRGDGAKESSKSNECGLNTAGRGWSCSRHIPSRARHPAGGVAMCRMSKGLRALLSCFRAVKSCTLNTLTPVGLNCLALEQGFPLSWRNQLKTGWLCRNGA